MSETVRTGRAPRTTLIQLADVVTGRAAVPAVLPRVFRSVGMAWQDLAMAAEVFRRAG